MNYCWVDNFCILQDNESDKFEQIPLMADAYRNADEVLIIHACELGLTQDKLDEATSEVEEALELYRLGIPFYDERCRPWRDGERYTRIVRAMEPLARFAKSDWCTRVWTLQEFKFARTIVWIGANSIPLTCEEILFGAIPPMCEWWRLNKLVRSPEVDRLYTLFVCMAAMRIPCYEPTGVMVSAARRIHQFPLTSYMAPWLPLGFK